MNDQLLSLIRKAFANEIPNGWLLGWDARRFQNALEKIADPFALSNQTSFDYSFCNAYMFVVSAGIRDNWACRVLISFIADYYCLYWSRYKPGKGMRHVLSTTPDDNRCKLIDHAIREMFASHGFLELPTYIGDKRVEFVELELSGRENVTVQKCLFEDFDG